MRFLRNVKRSGLRKLSYFFNNAVSFVLIFSTYILVLIAFKVYGMIDFFSCAERVTNFCSYQTFATGICAIFAALLTAFYLRKQTFLNGKNHNTELRISNLEKLSELSRESIGIASVFAGDLEGLIKRAYDADYVSFFNNQYESIREGKVQKIVAFDFNQDYLIVFNSLVTRIGVLGSNHASIISCWYLRFKGYLDTVTAVNENKYEGYDLSDIAKFLRDELQELIESAGSLKEALKVFIDDHQSNLDAYEREINDLLNIDSI